MKDTKTGTLDDLITAAVPAVVATKAEAFLSKDTTTVDPHAEDCKLFAKAIREAWDRKFERDLAEAD